MDNEEVFMDLQEDQDVTVTELDDKTLTPQAFAQIMKGSASWLKFIAVANMISIFMFLFLFVGILFYTRATLSIVTLVVYIVLLCVILWYWLTNISLLSHAGKAIKAIQTDKSLAQLGEFLFCLRRFFKLSGIGLAIYLGLAAIYIILANTLPFLMK